MDAVLLDPGALARRIQLPDSLAEQHQEITARVGGTSEPAYYHRRAVLHLHGNGHALGLPPNFPAWALASAWRGITLPYALCGPVVITGPANGEAHDGLEEDLLHHAEQASTAARRNHGLPAQRLLEEVATLAR